MRRFNRTRFAVMVASIFLVCGTAGVATGYFWGIEAGMVVAVLSGIGSHAVSTVTSHWWMPEVPRW